MTALTIPEAAEALDELYPGWFKRVPEDFDLTQPERCIGYAAFVRPGVEDVTLANGATVSSAWLAVENAVRKHTGKYVPPAMFADNIVRPDWVAEIEKRTTP